MPKPLLKKFYFMSPVQVVKVTTHNIEQAAEWCGGEIKTTDSRRTPGRVDRYVDVPTPKGAALSMAFPGMFITKRVVVSLENELKVSYGVFRINFFSRNYFQEPIDSVDAHWTRLANEEMKPEPVKEGAPSPVVMNIHVANPGEVGKALEAARAKLVQQDNPPVVVNVISHEGDVSEEVKAEADLIEMNTEILQFEQDMATGRELTPVEQRQLITEDAVEAEAEVDFDDPKDEIVEVK
jgi:hypothetical protein